MALFETIVGPVAQLLDRVIRHCERSEAIQTSWIAASPPAPRNDDLARLVRP